jgi:hypothetical protein
MIKKVYKYPDYFSKVPLYVGGLFSDSIVRLYLQIKGKKTQLTHELSNGKTLIQIFWFNDSSCCNLVEYRSDLGMHTSENILNQ